MTTPQRSNFRCWHRLRVRWAEVDMQKIVFNAHYLMYIDTAMSDYWRALALPYELAMQQLGGDVFVKKAVVEYHASARYDDQLDVGLRCARIGTSSIVFEAAIFLGDRLVVSAELVYVYANPTTQTSQPVPSALRAIFEGFEAGQPVATVAVGDWESLGDNASALRTEVFVQEQGIAAHMVWDDADAEAVHAVTHNRLHQEAHAQQPAVLADQQVMQQVLDEAVHLQRKHVLEVVHELLLEVRDRDVRDQREQQDDGGEERQEQLEGDGRGARDKLALRKRQEEEARDAS